MRKRKIEFEKAEKKQVLGSLPEGSYFCFHGLEDEFKNLKLLRSSESCCIISGLIKNKECVQNKGEDKLIDKWITLNSSYSVSSGSIIYALKETKDDNSDE